MVRIEDIDRVVHEPARYLILSILSVINSADMIFLKNQTGFTWGNLASHLGKLEDAGYVAIKKEFVGKKPHTTVMMTPAGRKAFIGYYQCMQDLLDKASMPAKKISLAKTHSGLD